MRHVYCDVHVIPDNDTINNPSKQTAIDGEFP